MRIRIHVKLPIFNNKRTLNRNPSVILFELNLIVFSEVKYLKYYSFAGVV